MDLHFIKHKVISEETIKTNVRRINYSGYGSQLRMVLFSNIPAVNTPKPSLLLSSTA